MSGPRPPRVPLRALAALSILVALAIVAERGRWFPRLLAAAAPSRTWIWSADWPREVRARCFFAVAEFQLARLPSAATLTVLGDPEYVATLNGRRIGSGRSRAPAVLDRYQVAAALRGGTNRIVLELRSPAGSGAATLRLEDESGRLLVESGADWRIYRSAWPGLFTAAPLDLAESAVRLGRSPFGRWGSPPTGLERPLFETAVAGQHPKRPLRYRLPTAGGAWQPIGHRLPRAASRSGQVELDFGHDVEGYLRLSLSGRKSAEAIVRFGLVASERSGWVPDAFVLVPAQSSAWQDVEPRRFRYVEIVGLDALEQIALLPVSDAAYDQLTPRAASRGAFGLEARPVRYPVAEEIWRRFSTLRREAATESSPPAGVAAAAPAPRRSSALRRWQGKKRQAAERTAPP